jgi:hypothetical protein
MVIQLRVLLSLAVCFFMSLAALAAPRTWTGAVNANWSQAGNWSPTGVPQPSDALTFPSGAANRDMTNDLPAGTAIGSMMFSGGPYTLSGNLLVLNGDVSGCTCNADLKLGAAVTFTNVNVNGALDAGGQTLTATGTQINGALNGTGLVIVRGVFSSGLTIKGAGNFSGTIQDDPAGGTLQLDGACSLPNATVALQQIMQFGSAATLGDVTITPSSSGVLTPGPGGILHTKSLTVHGGGVVAFLGAGASSQIDVKGTVTLTGARLLIGGGSLSAGQSVTIIQNDGTDPVAGTFLGLPEGTSVNGSQLATISYVGGDGNDVVVGSPAARTITNTVITQSTSSTPFGAPVTLTATVSSQSGTPTGSMTFVIDGVSTGSAGVQNGVATSTVTNLSVGDHTIAAAFHGAAGFLTTFADSTSVSISHTVSRGPTKTDVVAAQPGTRFGQTAHFTITVNALGPSSGQPSGSVSILAGGIAQGTAPLVNGVASFETSSLHAGGASITATYSGDTNFAPSTASAIQQNVSRAQTGLDIRLLPALLTGNRSVIGVSVNTVPGSALTPTGSVSITERGVVLAVQSLVTGNANFDLGSLPIGDHLFVITYAGGDDFEGSSMSVAQSVLAPAVSIYGTRVVEGNAGITTISLTVSLSAPLTETVRVSYATLDGSAHAAEDYEKTSGVVEFAPGEMSRSIELHIVPDTLPEPDESFVVVLSDPVNATMDKSLAFIEILNDDQQVPPRHRPSRH